MQHGKEPPLVASLYRRRPGVGFVGLGMAVNSENVNDTVPYGFTLEYFFDRRRLDKRSRAAVLCFDGAL